MPEEQTSKLDQKIFPTIKKLLGLSENEETPFDQDVMVGINTVISSLVQIGAIPNDEFQIETGEETWNDLVGSGKNLALVKSYIQLKVRQLFDPSTNGTVSQSIDNQIKELEWRLQIQGSHNQQQEVTDES